MRKIGMDAQYFNIENPQWIRDKARTKLEKYFHLMEENYNLSKYIYI